MQSIDRNRTQPTKEREMTQYMLSVHPSDDQFTADPDEQQKVYDAVDVLNAELQLEGAWVFAGGLHPPTTATVVSSRDGEILFTDGPFIEGKEHVGGFWVIEAADLDAALAWAAKATVACAAPVEVRPFQEVPGD
jgi:hypothetical protein